MKLKSDPVRLADSLNAGPIDLAAAVRALRARDTSPAEVEALGRRLAPQLTAPTTAGTAGVALTLWAKWSAFLLVAFAAGFYGLMLLMSQTHAPPRPRAPAPALVAAPLPPPPLPLTTTKPPVASPAVASTPSVRRPRARHEPPATPAPAAPLPEAELALLKQAQAALDREPRTALALVEQHAQSYPRGLFAQEREILAIEALLKLRQKPAALARAQAFVQRYPESPHARRVHSLLERSPLASPQTIAPGSDHPSEDIQR
jgi:hypothetical protein